MPAFTKRLAAQQALDSHPRSFQRAIFLDGVLCIFRACWLKSAGGRKERRDSRFVDAQQIENEKLHCVNPFCHIRCGSPHTSNGL